MPGTHTVHTDFFQHLCTVLWVCGRRQPDAAQPGHAEEPLLRPARWPEGAPSRATGTADTAASADPHERPNYGKPWSRRHRPRQQQHANAWPPARRGPRWPTCCGGHRATGRRATGVGLGGCGRAVGGPARLQQLLWWLLKGQTGGKVFPHELHGEWLQDASVQDLLPRTRTCESGKHVSRNVEMRHACQRGSQMNPLAFLILSTTFFLKAHKRFYVFQLTKFPQLYVIYEANWKDCCPFTLRNQLPFVSLWFSFRHSLVKLLLYSEET